MIEEAVGQGYQVTEVLIADIINWQKLFHEDLRIYIRVSQKTQKSEFCFATNPSGFHRLDEPPEKISAL